MTDNIDADWTQLERNNVGLVKRVFEDVFNKRRTEIIPELFSPDYIAHYEHETTTGPEDWTERFYRPMITAIPDFHIEVEAYLPKDNCVVIRWVARGTHDGDLLGVAPTHKPIVFTGISWSRLHDGKIVENWNRWNMSYLLLLMQQELKTLRQFLPICCVCKKIRDDSTQEDDKDHWVQIERYISQHTDASFSHGYCPECYEKALKKIDES
jgi:steroid delta-isomerase-like uncharacterized protein